MGTFKIGRVELGEKVYCTEQNRMVLAPDVHTAKEVLKQLRVPYDSLTLYATLSDACYVAHRLGTTVVAHKAGELLVMDTVLVFGSPRGLDTTRPNKVTYKR